MICLAYLSSAAAPLDGAAIDQILAASRRNNVAAEVTGMLCYYDGSFLQFLEGEAEDVDAIFAGISSDARHKDVLTLYRRSSGERLFADWSMALAKPEVVGEEHQAFCKGLRHLEVGATEAHQDLIAPFLDSFRAWMR
jgi:hypothetical protein